MSKEQFPNIDGPIELAKQLNIDEGTRHEKGYNNGKTVKMLDLDFFYRTISEEVTLLFFFCQKKQEEEEVTRVFQF